jgi:hypothetical protein
MIPDKNQSVDREKSSGKGTVGSRCAMCRSILIASLFDDLSGNAGLAVAIFFVYI